MILLRSLFFDKAFSDVRIRVTLGKIEENYTYWYKNINSEDIRKDTNSIINKYFL